MLSQIANAQTLISVLNALPMGLVWKDRNGVYIGANSITAIRVGLSSPGALVGCTDFDFMSSEQAEHVRAIDRRVMETGEPVLGIVEKMTTHKGERWAEMNRVPLRDASNQIVGVVISFRDITDRVHLQDERNELIAQLTSALDAAEAGSRAKSQFLANMSHELRTPLNAIIGYAELVEEMGAGPETASDVQRIQRSAKHLLSLINDVLDLAKIEAGHAEAAASDVDLVRLVEESIDLVAPAAANNGNAIIFDDAAGECAARGDEIKLRQCLLNLLSNAVKFTKNGTIRVGLRKNEPGRVDIVVHDTGIGMTEAQVGQVFEPFMQADSSIALRHGGTGLGLSITRSLMELMGGEVRAESVYGVGSTFTLIIPTEAPLPRRGPALPIETLRRLIAS